MFGERALLALDGFFLGYAQDPNLALWPTFEGETRGRRLGCKNGARSAADGKARSFEPQAETQ